ncbi:MAG: cupin domain-containing protein [Patescibacteria group bacterium]
MELSERFIKILEDEGFTHVFEWQDKPGTIYQTHTHKGKVTIFITDGSVTFDFSGDKKEVKAGERFDVPVGAPHSAIVGSQGALYVVGEMIEGDS